MVSSKNFKYKKWAEKINPPQHLTKNQNTPYENPFTRSVP